MELTDEIKENLRHFYGKRIIEINEKKAVTNIYYLSGEEIPWEYSISLNNNNEDKLFVIKIEKFKKE
jgi:hypothetical protein